MKFTRTTIKTIRIDMDLLDNIEEVMNQHGWDNLSEFLRSAIKIFIRLERTKSIMNDPEKWRKLQEEMNAQFNENSMFDWVASMDDSKLKGFKGLIELEEEKRIRLV